MLFVGRPYALGALERTAREMVHEMRDTLEMLNAWSARQAKREKREAQSALEEPQSPVQMPLALEPPKTRKAALRRKVAAMRGLPGAVAGGSQMTTGLQPENTDEP